MSIAKFFARRRTIESITAPITSIVSKLETHAAIHTDAAQAHEVKASVHADLAAEAAREVDRAKEQAAKFAKMFS